MTNGRDIFVDSYRQQPQNMRHANRHGQKYKIPLLASPAN